MRTNHSPRVALAGVVLESNSFAPVVGEEDFRNRYYFEGREILEQAAAAHSVMPMEMTAFVRAMHATGPWQPLPLILTGTEPGGPVEHGFFVRTVDAMIAALAKAGPVDAVYLSNHGAMTTTESHDPDGEMTARVREAVGPDATIVVTLDLHANISERLVEAADLIVGYQTNPHVDMLERGEEAAQSLRTILAGARPVATFIRLPLTPASVVLLSREGAYADLIDFGQRRKRELGGAIFNVSIFGGFVFGDTPKNGVAVVVTGRDDDAAARELAVEIAARGWADRQRFRKHLMPLEEAVSLAVRAANEPSAEAVIFSDAGDNPGGGGLGTTTWLLAALVQAGARGVLFGSFCDAALAAEAHAKGQGASFEAVFNRDGESEFSRRFSARARILSLGDGEVVGRRGLYANRAMQLGPCCALEIGGAGGIVVVVISNRRQTADPMFFEMLGLDIGAARCVCVKSRGHFRAGFDLWFAPGQVYEVDTAGLTSPVLERFQWRGLPRPVYPLDEDAEWVLPPELASNSVI
ncbi:MAG: M81 family metallopeptidase [Gammaproteobacteria bacterium]|nr:MAG: M81 family metallopeptidase [Gammaproteobacteria bacterium]